LSRTLHRLALAELTAGYASGEFTPTDVVEHLLERIARLDPKLRSFIEVDQAGARAAAAESGTLIAANAGRPLEGVPIAVKANIHMQGLETNAGMEARRGIVAVRDADAVARLRAAGAIMLGTLNMHEAALGADNDNPWFGRAINPHGDHRTPGGSSGGSGIAAAAGLSTVSLGTDTLGSVRIPAAYCGVYGLKPTAGAVSQHGVELVAQEFDTIGPLARTLDDLEGVMRCLGSFAKPEPITSVTLLEDLGGVRCEEAVIAAYERAVRALRMEGLRFDETIRLDLKPIRLAGFVQASRELGRRLGELREAKASSFSKSLLFLLDYGSGCSEDQVAEGTRMLSQARSAINEAIGKGVMLLPTTPQAGFLHGSRAPANQADFTAPASISGLPALSIPAGVDPAGMPVAVQLVGAAGNELGLIDLARRLEPHLGGFVPPAIF
jgi:aspartyl-tRNA(Asn)/glutamyl-tRNA(Gln) amidotransferase subunit A